MTQTFAERGIKLALAAYPDTGLEIARETNRGSAVSAAAAVPGFVVGMAPVTRIARPLWNRHHRLRASNRSCRRVMVAWNLEFW